MGKAAGVQVEAKSSMESSDTEVQCTPRRSEAQPPVESPDQVLLPAIETQPQASDVQVRADSSLEPSDTIMQCAQVQPPLESSDDVVLPPVETQLQASVQVEANSSGFCPGQDWHLGRQPL